MDGWILCLEELRSKFRKVPFPSFAMASLTTDHYLFKKKTSDSTVSIL